MFSKYAKLIPPLLGGIAMVVLTGVINGTQGDHLIDGQEAIQMVIQGLSLVAMWGAANVPGWSKAKGFQYAVFAVLNALTTFIIGGMDLTEWLNLAIVFLAGLGIPLAPAPPAAGTTPTLAASRREAARHA